MASGEDNGRGKAQEKRARKLRRENASPIIRKNVAASKNEYRQAERVVTDRAVLEKAERQGELSRQVRRRLERKRAEVESRAMRLLERDDAYVRGLLERHEPVEGAYPLDGTTDGDEFMYVLVEHLDLLPALEATKPDETYLAPKTGKVVRRREMHAPVVMNLLSLVCRYLGFEAGPDIQTGVFADERWMALVGYAPMEVKSGYTRRSAGLLGKTREGEGGRFAEADELGPERNRSDLTEVRGVLSSQSLAAYEQQLPLERVMGLVNQAIAKVASKRLLGKRLEGVLDTTCIEVSPTFEGAGMVRRKVKVATKSRRPRTVEAMIRGFKVWLLMDAETAIPLAMAMGTIEVADVKLARQVVEQARANLEGHAVLSSLAIDRGFLDGDFFWWLKKEQRIDWVCPSKEKMKVTQEARELVEQALKKARKGKEELSETARRLARKSVAMEGVSFCEHILAAGRESLVIANVEGLYETDFYGEGGSDSSRVHSKKYRVTPLYASVILNWPDRPRDDIEDQKAHDEDEPKGPVVILSPVQEKGRARFDRYDRRSRIENLLNREGKQHFALGSALARNAAAMGSAVCFSVLALLVWRVMLVLQEQAETGDRKSERLGIKRYRRLMAMRSKGKVLVHTDGRYIIMDMMELMQLLGALKR